MTTERAIEQWAEPIEIDCWPNLNNIFGGNSNKRNWVYRGLSDSRMLLLTSLDRAIAKFSNLELQEQDIEYYRNVLREGLKDDEGTTADPFAVSPTVLNLEDGLLRRFQRQCHHYMIDTPDPDDTLEWLALMRHYRAPSRLLDWTYSLFVAVYFALVDAKGECVVWAIDLSWIRKRIKQILAECGASYLWTRFQQDRNITEKDTFDTLFRQQQPIPLVYPLSAYRLNQRLVVQQGTFLCPTDVSKPFEDNLAGLWAGPETGPSSKGNFIKYIIKANRSNRKEILQNLYRMNINHSTLFPGLDGFAKSLETLLIFPHILQPHQGFDQ